jgi:hypothetical protein
MGGGRIDGPPWIWVLGRLANVLEGGFAPVTPLKGPLSLENPDLSLMRQIE